MQPDPLDPPWHLFDLAPDAPLASGYRVLLQPAFHPELLLTVTMSPAPQLSLSALEVISAEYQHKLATYQAPLKARLLAKRRGEPAPTPPPPRCWRLHFDLDQASTHAMLRHLDRHFFDTVKSPPLDLGADSLTVFVRRADSSGTRQFLEFWSPAPGTAARAFLDSLLDFATTTARHNTRALQALTNVRQSID